MRLKLNYYHIGIFMSLILLNGCASLDSKAPTPTSAIDTEVANEYSKALSAAKKGNTKTAIKLLQAITEKHQDFSAAFTNLGLQHLAAENHKQAEAALRKALKINPEDAVACNHLGVILRFKGQFDDARDMYANAIKLKPDYALAHYNIGILYDIYLYELPLALNHYRQYLDLSDKDDELVKQWVTDLELRVNQQNTNKG